MLSKGSIHCTKFKLSLYVKVCLSWLVLDLVNTTGLIIFITFVAFALSQ